MADDGTVEQGARVRPGLLRPRSYHVHVVAGPDAGAGATLATGTLLVGTHEHAGLRLTDPEVSRYHLELRHLPTGIAVEDLRSSYGTFQLDGDAPMKIGSIALPSTDRTPRRFRLGSTTILEIEPLESRAAGEEAPSSFGEAIGGTPQLRDLFALLGQVAPTDATVLLEGETGTGKELFAEGIHRSSPRRARPFVVIDCAALPAALIGSELFGHARGAFSGADQAKRGLIEQADGGTVFLDEIGDLPLALQPNLLRVLERREVHPLGDPRARAVDVRFIAASRAGLGSRVRAGTFREDLFFRLAVVRAHAPPLRKHREDIPLLVRAFTRQLGRRDFELSSDTLAQLMAYDWPGNVRELRNLVERGLSLGTTEAELDVDAARLGAPTGDPNAARAPEHLAGSFKDAKARLLEAFERTYLLQLLERHHGNIAQAALEAGIDRNHVHRLVKKHAIVVDRG